VYSTKNIQKKKNELLLFTISEYKKEKPKVYQTESSSREMPSTLKKERLLQLEFTPTR